ncbi:class I SAM-dependent methyltransferase [Nostoc sp. NIES-2111]
MAEWTSGIYRLVGVPSFYLAFQDALGASSGRKRLVREFIRPEHARSVLDLGCGSAAILDLLPPATRYLGIDRNSAHIEKARRLHGDRGMFHAGNFDDPVMFDAAPFDIVLALGLLHHLEDEEVRALFQLARSVLAQDGRFLSVDPVFVSGQHPVARFLIGRDSGRNVRNREGYERLASDIFSRVDVTIAHDYLRVPYSHCLMQLSA